VVKGWLARNRYRGMVRDQAYRDRVAHEILTTERVYVEHLEIYVKTHFAPPPDVPRHQQSNPNRKGN